MQSFTKIVSLLALSLSVAAISVTTPSNSSGWTSTGTNTLAWNRVNTDPTNFTVVLTNTDRTALPTNNQLLVALVDATSQNSISVPPPSGGLPTGKSFRVNLIKDQNDVNSIYAQSDEFEITSGGSTTSSGSSTLSVTSVGSGSTVTIPATTGTGSGSGSGSGSQTTGTDSSSGLNPTTTPNSGMSNTVQIGFLGAMLAVAAFLA